MSTLTCAIQFGSNRIMAIAAMKDMKTGTLSNIQIESESARDCICYGCVSNVEQAAMHIRSIIQKLGNRMRATITSAHVGAGGMSLHSLVQQPTVQIPEYDVLDSTPLSEGQYQLIVGQKRIRQRIQAAMDRAGVQLNSFIVLPKATACILTPEMRQRGCVLIDMGATTTTVSIYHQDQLRHLAVIPMGGDNVTIDIQSSGCTFEEAERNKTDWSDVSQETPTDSATSGTSGNALFADKTLSMPLSKLNTIALCRYEEIAANIRRQIEISGLQDKLEAGCILTGGAAVQRGLLSLLRRRLNVSRIEMRAYHEATLLSSERRPHLANTLALLNFCTEDCQATIKPAAPVAPSTPTPAPAAQSAAPQPTDGQLNLDIPDDPEPASKPEPGSHPVRGMVSRFLRDLITGQDDTPTTHKRK